MRFHYFHVKDSVTYNCYLYQLITIDDEIFDVHDDPCYDTDAISTVQSVI